jgi:predicted RNA binding protein YcfA (HicA-like mRNA interferase family)
MARVKELLRFLRKHGYEEARQKGSHRILTHPVRRMLSVPIHTGDVPRGLLLRILKDAGFSEEDFFGGRNKKGKA